MLPELEKIKGIHPGYILRRELNFLKLKSSELALSLDEHKQTISAIINKRRKITPALSIKLAKKFNVSQDYFMILQASYDVDSIVKQNCKAKKPDLKKIRPVLFWDTDINKINWIKQKRAVIKRILERGNKKEIEEIIQFYGKDQVSSEIKHIKHSQFPSFKENVEAFNL